MVHGDRPPGADAGRRAPAPGRPAFAGWSASPDAPTRSPAFASRDGPRPRGVPLPRRLERGLDPREPGGDHVPRGRVVAQSLRRDALQGLPRQVDELVEPAAGADIEHEMPPEEVEQPDDRGVAEGLARPPPVIRAGDPRAEVAEEAGEFLAKPRPGQLDRRGVTGPDPRLL